MSDDRLFDPGPPTRRESFFHFTRDGKDWEEFSAGVVHAGTKNAALERAGITDLEGFPKAGPEFVHELGVRPEAALNTPEEPVSDYHANVSMHGKNSLGIANMPQPDEWKERLAQNDRKFPQEAIEDAYLDEGKGVFYVNDVEDRGSISAAIPVEGYEHRATHKVTPPTVAVEGTHTTALRFPSPVKIKGGSASRVSQDRLLPVTTFGDRGRYLGSPQWDRIR